MKTGFVFLAFAVLFVIVNIAITLAIARKRRADENRTTFNFTRRKVLTDTEVVFFQRLREALPELHVFPQVGLSRVIEPGTGLDYPTKTGLLNRIAKKSVDFVVCAPDFATVAAIELDDASHNQRDRQRADATKDAALNAAGVPIIRWNVYEMPTAAQIREEFTRPRK